MRDKKKKKIPYYNIHNIVHVYITRLLHRLLCCVMDARVIQVYGTRDYNIINYIPIYIIYISIINNMKHNIRHLIIVSYTVVRGGNL